MTPDEIEKALDAGAGLVPVAEKGMVNIMLVEDPWAALYALADKNNDAAAKRAEGGRKRREPANLLTEFIRRTYLESRFQTVKAAAENMGFCEQVMAKSKELNAHQKRDNVERRIVKALVGVKKQKIPLAS